MATHYFLSTPLALGPVFGCFLNHMSVRARVSPMSELHRSPPHGLPLHHTSPPAKSLVEVLTLTSCLSP